MHSLTRRNFLKSSAATVASLTALQAAGAADKPNEKLVLAVMGVKGRGRGILSGFSKFDDVEIGYVCDCDDNGISDALKSISDNQKKTRKVANDIRKVLEDPAVNAIAIAAPDHWHALARIWGCQHGKHVYVEKPVSHNLVEGRRMVEAARKYDKVVMVGTQRRSGPQ